MASSFPIVAISLLALVPFSLADTQIYAGPGRVSTNVGSFDLVLICGSGFGVGGGCSFPCSSSCVVNVTDPLGGPQAFRVCRWDGAHDTNCLDAVGQLTYMNSGTVVDVFVANGIAGQIRVS